MSPSNTLKISNFMRRNERGLRYATLVLFSVLVIGFSIWQGAYNLDPHHWGLMLSNAKDLSEGRLPYKDIFIQYGILTTIVQGMSYTFLGHNLQSLILITAIAYAVGLLGIYYLSFYLIKSRKLAIYTFVTCVLLHGVAIYPWSNYIAFPFLVFGMLAFVSGDVRRTRMFIAGLLLAAAVLCREGLFPPVIIFMIIATLVQLTRQTGDGKGTTLALFWLGFSIPICSFFAYIYAYDLSSYWYKTSIVLPKLYAELFIQDGWIASAWRLARYFISGTLDRNFRIFFLGLIVLAALLICVGVILRRAPLKMRWDLFLLSVFTLLLLSASLHLNEIFRLSTSITLGAVLVYYFAAHYKFESYVFIVFAVILTITFARGGNGNYFLPTMKQITLATTSATPSLFAGQKWPAEAFDYYKSVERDLSRLRDSSCGIKYYSNDTKDVFITTLTPFIQYQLAPFGRGMNDMAGWKALRPEYDLRRKVAVDKDIVIFATVKQSDIDDYLPPADYFVVNRYQMPYSFFFEEGDFLFIVAPQACAKAGA